MYSPLPYVVRQVLFETYKACGWDVSKDKRGRPITFDDFEFQAEKVSRSLGYEKNVTMDIEAALKARIFSLTLGGKGALFNTVASIAAEEILRRRTVIVLQDIPNAIKNTATKIAHRVPAADDRGVLAGAMNLTEEQAPAFSALQPGEAIISVEKHPIPIKILVPNTIDKIGLPVGEIGGEEVKRHMTEFYLRNPLPRAPQSPLVADLLLIVESRWFKAGFVTAYFHWLATGAKEQLANLLIQSAKKKARSDEDVFPFASRILSLAAERYLFFDEEKNEFPDVFMRSVERSMRDDKGVS